MENTQLQVYAGGISTLLFIASILPMLHKAITTRDLKSYSLSYLVLSNLGNLIHWVYISSLPFGPIWFLHGFYTLVTGVMLLWYFRYELSGSKIFKTWQPQIELTCFCGFANEREFTIRKEVAL